MTGDVYHRHVTEQRFASVRGLGNARPMVISNRKDVLFGQRNGLARAQPPISMSF